MSSKGVKAKGPVSQAELLPEFPIQKEIHPMFSTIAKVIPTADRQVAYGHYARARYGDNGVGGVGLECMELVTIARYRVREGVSEVGPLSLAPITLSQNNETTVHIHGRRASDTQKALHSRLNLWQSLKLPGKTSFHLGVSAGEALNQFNDSSLDEISVRRPPPEWSQSDMRELSDKMISKLNLESNHPKGPNVLIGLEESRGGRLIDVFSERLQEAGLQEYSAGTYDVAGEGKPARLLFIKKK